MFPIKCLGETTIFINYMFFVEFVECSQSGAIFYLSQMTSLIALQTLINMSIMSLERREENTTQTTIFFGKLSS